MSGLRLDDEPKWIDTTLFFWVGSRVLYGDLLEVRPLLLETS